ncbi:IclR family transcriptional regulator [Pseudarthrobacter sp. NamB4]|uniref:IclR family transcriptional regulator n=1 Tax=Pseudarthrobacter sp. NamB4 TaxID=2576837 RepID=UPI0010FD1F93|nr:IclR family transcriptional regulator [Pseudarthrobacter sp. NamB4]TLM72239.1 IclR family transcriptional regulator [Pseudarthrobacter sp. NamB4]
MSQTVDRALQILPFLGEGEKDLAETAEMLGVHKSTALRLLQTLEAQGYVRHNDTHRYRLGPQLFKLAAVALGSLDIRPIAAPYIRMLGEKTQQTIHLAAFDEGEVFYIDKYEAQTAVRMYSRIGATAPLYCTGVAKAIMAHRPMNEQIELAHRIEYVRHTERTIVTAEAFLAELEQIRQRGYAIDDREHEDFIHCVAVPIITGSGAVSHAVSVSAPVITLPHDQLLGLEPLLQETAAAIGREFT